MKLNLEILASTSIKRKKPWPKITWIGDEYESLLLLDQQFHRASVLYVPSGKTKRRINKLSPFLHDTVAINRTRNGHFLLGLQHTGELFVWYKDKDVIKTVTGLEGILPQHLDGTANVYGSDDLCHIVVSVGTNQIYVWEKNGPENTFLSASPEIHGTWNGVTVPRDIDVPRASECRELSSDVIFFTHQSLGRCCQYSMMFNNTDSLCAVTLLLRFNRASTSVHSENLPSFHVEWNIIQYPYARIVQGFTPINSRGSLVSKYTCTGQVVAVAANQNRPSKSAILFVSPLTDTVLVASLKGCGVKDQRSKRGRNYWVSDLAWTSDDLFLACIMKSGLVCLITRLGEPQVIQTVANRGVELGPSLFLPLHPLQIVSADSEGHVLDKNGRSVSPSSTTSDLDAHRQRFSVTAHPSLPIILFSDGFMVTVAQLKEDMSNLTLMRDLLVRSARHLKDIKDISDLDLSVFDAYSLPSHREGKHGKPPPGKQRKPFRFEEPDTLNTTLDSETSFSEHAGPGMAAINAGKISFAECDSPLVDPDNFSGLSGTKLLARHFYTAENYLTTVWRLAVSYTEPWNAEAENIAKQTVSNLIKFFAIILECPGIEDILSRDKSLSTDVHNPRLFTVVQSYRKTFELLRFDIINQNLMPMALKVVNDTLNLVLNSPMLRQTDPRIKTLSGCYAILKESERIINRVYVWVPKDSPYTGLPPETPGHQKHAYEPAILMKAQISPRAVAREIIYADPRTLGLDQHAQLPGRRLCASWKLLYKSLVQYQSHLRNGPEKDLEQVRNLVFAVEQTIRQIDGEVPKLASPKISRGEKYSLDGRHTLAVDAWQNQLKDIPDADAEKMVQVLHSVLYTFIMKGELNKAVDFVDSLVIQVNARSALTDQLPTCSPGQGKPPLMTIVMHTLRSQETMEAQFVPCIKERPVRQLVQSMARFMSAYFTNESLYIFPPHNPQPLPSNHMGKVTINSRIIPQYHADLNSRIAKDGLNKTWSTERTLEYLLLSGLVCEAAWFADKMGDWKAAFMLSVGCTEHGNIISKLYKKKRKPLQLPESLSPEAILKQKLEALIRLDKRSQTAVASKEKHHEFIPIDDETNLVQLSRTLEDILTAGVIGNIEVVPWLLSTLVDKLKRIISQLSPLVPQDFYLPSPPMYCPQPTDTSQDGKPAEVEREKRLRFQASSLIQLLLLVMNSAHISLPAIRWYVHELAGIQERAAQFKSTTEGPCLELPEILQDMCKSRSVLSELQGTPSVEETLKSVRDFYTLLWLLHCRDKLSYNLKSREAYLNNVNYQDYVRDSWESKDGEQWTKECFTTLQWAVNMLTFCRFLPDEGCLYKVILSLLHELPNNEETADILAEHFYAPENLDVEVQEKLEKFLDDWKSVFIEPEDDGKSAKPEQQEVEDDENDGRKSVTFYEASPRGKSLSVYFTKQCEVVMKVLKKKSKIYGVYEEFVFDETGKIPCGTLTASMVLDMSVFSIGSRPFETKLSFLEFLDTFSAIAYTKLLDSSGSGPHAPLPLLLSFADDICREQFREMENKVRRAGEQNSLQILSSPQGKVSRTPSESHMDAGKTGKYKSKGLFRSQSNGQDGKGDQSPQRMKANISQSEEPLHIPQEEGGWLLDVNFGRKYDHLKHVLHWLAAWSRKQHSLGLNWKGEKDLAFKPAMRIEVPPQLVLLSLWLLEHKYCPVVKQQPASVTNGSSLESNGSKQVQIEDIAEQVNAQVLEAVRQKSRGKHPKRKKDKSDLSSMLSGSGLESQGSQALDEDTNNIQSAYEDVLNGNDSSSLEVSSLDPEEYGDDLRHTLTMINGSESLRNSRDRKKRSQFQNPNISTLDRTYYKSPERHENYRSPERRNTHPTQSPNTSTPVAQWSTRRPSRERQEVREQFVARTAGHSEAGHHDNMLGNDLATQLQQIVRGELRRMMEAQHRSMMAMMGAFDDTMVLQGQGQLQGQLQGQIPSQRQGVSPQRYSRDVVANTMTVEELNMEESVRGRRSSPGRPTDDGVRGRRSSPRRPPNAREVLTELNELQENTRPRRKSRSPSQGRSGEGQGRPLSMSALRDEKSEPYAHSHREGYEKYLYVTHAERDTDTVPRLPPIPLPAWAEDTQPRDLPQHGALHMPLLQLERGPAPLITPRNHEEGMPYFHPSQFQGPIHEPRLYSPTPQVLQPPPALLNQQDNRAPQIQGQRGGKESESQKSHFIEMPLLKLAPEEKPFLGEPSFGRLIEPSLLIGEEQRQEQEEMQRKKPLLEFYKQQTEMLEAQRREEMGRQLLKADLKTTDEKDLSRSRSLRRRQRKAKQPSESVTESETEKEKSVSVKERVASPRKDLSETQPPVVSSEGGEEGDTEEEDLEGKIYDGYAIQPGSFENYLEMDQKDFEADTNARVQYKTAMIMKQQRAREKRKKVDFSTMTKNYEDASIETGMSLEMDDRRTAEAATSITKDKGVDPIQEAVLEYNRARQGTALPPDIYLGLRFTDGEGQPTSNVTGDGQEKPKGRSYINVVDLDAEAVLNDLSRKPDKEIQQDLGFKPQSISVREGDEQDLTQAEESMREALRPRGEPVQSLSSKQDSVTVKMFESKALGENRVSVAVLPCESVQGSRGAILERLRDMGRQMEAIDQISTNVERGFKNTRLMLGTLEALTGADEGEPEAGQRSEEESVRRSKEKTTPKKSARSPGVSARTTARTPKTSSMEREKQSDALVRMSGLSGISDIIGEMVERGDIDLEEAGFSEKEAVKLADRIKTSARSAHTVEEQDRIRRSLEYLETLSREAKTQEEHMAKEEERAQIHAWMMEKRAERMREYKKKRADLREHERRPFKPDLDTKFKGTFTTDRDRKTQGQSDMKQRMREAQMLLGDILTDKPELPPEVPAREKSPKRKRSPPRETSPRYRTRDISPSYQTRDISPMFRSRDRSPVYQPRDRSPQQRPRTVGYKERDYSPKRQTVTISPEVKRKEYERHAPVAQDQQRDKRTVRTPARRPASPVREKSTPVVPRLKLQESDEFMQKTGETTGEINAYQKIVEEMEDSQDITPHPRKPEKEPDVPSGKIYKQKSFKDLVRLQRPEITRKKPVSRIPVSEAMMEESRGDTDRTTARTDRTAQELSVRERERIYGSKHLPGQMKQHSPRQVKTYAERLKEMKSKQTYSTPIVPRSHTAGSVHTSHETIQRRPTGPARRPMTYVEQLQKLNKGTHHKHAGPGTKTVKMQTFMKSHKPIHKPRTYVEQLKGLQPPQPAYKKVAPSRKQTRPRPYADPYRKDENVDRDSVLSDWSVDENVRRLLYEEDASSMAYKTSYGGMSVDYTVTEGGSDYYEYVMGEEYIGSVDIDEIAQIADAASVRSGSVMSVIDWDAVDDLIADVK